MFQFDKSAFTIVSGGQTGVDQAGLHAAFTHGITTGGWAPNGWITSIGPNQALLRDKFGLKEHRGGYRPRTLANVKDSDVTVIISRVWNSPGTILTKNGCMKHAKPYIALNEDWTLNSSCKLSYVFSNNPLFRPPIHNTLSLNKLSIDDINTFKNQQIDAVASLLMNYRTINIAGNAENNAPGIEQSSYTMLCLIFDRMFK